MRSARSIRWVLFFLLLLFLAACGYHREGVRVTSTLRESLYIELLTNNTHRAFINDTVTTQFVERFSRSPYFSIVEDPAQADLILSGAVTLYESAPVAYNRLDAIAAYRADLSVLATLRRPHADREILWRQTVSSSQDYLADNPDLVTPQSAARIADEVYVQVTNLLFWEDSAPRP